MLLVAAVCLATVTVPAQVKQDVTPGVRGAGLLKGNKYVDAPKGLTWMACWLQFARVNPRQGGPTIVAGGPYLIPEPDDFSAVKQRFMDTWRTEYLQRVKPTEFPMLKYTAEEAARNHGCIIGSSTATTARVWEAHVKEPNRFARTEFVPSFAR